jgi:hypothetical protein
MAIINRDPMWGYFENVTIQTSGAFASIQGPCCAHLWSRHPLALSSGLLCLPDPISIQPPHFLLRWTCRKHLQCSDLAVVQQSGEIRSHNFGTVELLSCVAAMLNSGIVLFTNY